jgi:hypothetical protein
MRRLRLARRSRFRGSEGDLAPGILPPHFKFPATPDFENLRETRAAVIPMQNQHSSEKLVVL